MLVTGLLKSMVRSELSPGVFYFSPWDADGSGRTTFSKRAYSQCAESKGEEQHPVPDDLSW